MSMKTYNLRPLWDELLRIYEAIAEVCRRNGIQYFANGGTMLGAIRHKGFIPWDDDLDLYMPREDYSRFIELAQSQLPSGLEWKSIEVDDKYAYLFGKVVIRDQDLVRKISAESGLPLVGGIYVDVFPLDGLPTSRLGQFLFCVKRGLFRRAIASKQLWGRLLLSIGRCDQQNRLKFQNWYAKHRYGNSLSVGAVSPYDDYRTPQRWVFRREWFRTVTMMPFDRVKIPVPEGYDKILKGQFGDYMQLPPERARHPSHQIERARNDKKSISA